MDTMTQPKITGYRQLGEAGKRYDDPAVMWVSQKKAHHRACDAARAAARNVKRKDAQ